MELTPIGFTDQRALEQSESLESKRKKTVNIYSESLTIVTHANLAIVSATGKKAFRWEIPGTLPIHLAPTLETEPKVRLNNRSVIIRDISLEIEINETNGEVTVSRTSGSTFLRMYHFLITDGVLKEQYGVLLDRITAMIDDIPNDGFIAKFLELINSSGRAALKEFTRLFRNHFPDEFLKIVKSFIPEKDRLAFYKSLDEKNDPPKKA